MHTSRLPATSQREASPAPPPPVRAEGAFSLTSVGTVLVLLAFLAFLVPWRAEQGSGLAGSGVLLAGVAAVLVYDHFRLRGGGSLPLAVGVLALVAVLAEGIMWLDNFWIAAFAVLVVPTRAVRYFGERAGAVIALVTWAAVLGQGALLGQITPLTLASLLVWSAALVFLVERTAATIRERAAQARTAQVLRDLEESHRQLQAYAAQAETLAASEERNRIAREIHDSLGHYLTAINVQLEKALVELDHEPPAARGTIAETRRLAGEVLQDVRRSVAALRAPGEVFSARTAITRLADDVRRGGHLAVDLTISGDEAGYAPQTLLSLYRVAQEGLTNAQKHAAATAVRLDLTFAGGTARLALCDDGRGFAPASGGGYGLQGMRERLAALGGALEITSAPGGGSCLHATAPASPTVAMPPAEAPPA